MDVLAALLEATVLTTADIIDCAQLLLLLLVLCVASGVLGPSARLIDFCVGLLLAVSIFTGFT